MVLLLLLSLLALSSSTSIPDPAAERNATNVFHLHLSLSKTPGAMSIAWVSYGPVKYDQYVQYGRYRGELKWTAQPEVSRSMEEEDNPLGHTWVYKAHMGGLIPNSVVYYRIVSKDDKGLFHYTPVYQFKSKPESAFINSVKFAAFGDMGITENATWTEKRLEQLVLSKPTDIDFVVHLGDLAYSFEHWWKWNQWFNMMEPVTSRTPYMVVTGNRDRENVVRDRLLMPVAFNLENHKPTCLEKDNTYYDFDYGIVAVVTLPFRAKYDCPQLFEWLEQTLERYHYRVKDNNDPMRWIVVAIHTPFYSSSNGHTGGNKPLKDAIEHLFIKYKVDIGIFGDDHNYERTHPVFDDVPDTHFTQEKDKDGKLVSTYHNPHKPLHFLIGTGGIGLDDWQSAKPPSWSAYREIYHGFVHFEVTPNSIKGKFMRSVDGTERDHFLITKDGYATRETPSWTSGSSGIALSQTVAFWFIAVVSGTLVFCYKRRGGNIIGFESKGR